MRRLPVALLALVALLAGCGADEEADEPATTVAAPSTATPATTAVPTTPVTTAPEEPSSSTGPASASAAAPPEALISGGGQTELAGLGSYCWTNPASGAGVCADSAAPRCDDGFTPRLAVPAGSMVEWIFQFVPAEEPVLTVHDAAPGADQPALPAALTTQWTVDLPPGEHAISLFVRPEDGGDVSYTACLDVTG